MQCFPGSARSRLSQPVLKYVLCLWSLVFVAASSIHFCASAASAEEKATSSNKAETKQRYTRMDFRIDGASCVTCIRRVAQRIKKGKGVLQADISIYRPHWAVVIFETDKTDSSKVVELIKKEKKVEVVGLETQYLSSIPPIVIPRVKDLEPGQR